ncbi:hypothetical protein [Burkholderia glumae]|uniref:hypothetical protein n=1 Tax=Burkholderia glumae TaxID=337 RepID=UPI003B9A8C4E
MDQQDMPEVSLREARDIVAMLWHRAALAGGARHRGGVVRTEAVTAHEVAAPCAVTADAPAANREEPAGVLDAPA